MRNIYFVEFGNCNVEEVTDKIIFPIETVGTISMQDAEDRLSHLKSILHKNCVISITDGVVKGNYSEIYNLDNGTLHNYDVTYMLITVIEREVATENFATLEDARKTMIKEVLDYIKDENDETILDEYNQYCDEEGCYYDGEEIGIYIAAAWANSESAFENADWRIVVC